MKKGTTMQKGTYAFLMICALATAINAQAADDGTIFAYEEEEEEEEASTKMHQNPLEAKLKALNFSQRSTGDFVYEQELMPGLIKKLRNKEECQRQVQAAENSLRAFASLKNTFFNKIVAQGGTVCINARIIERSDGTFKGPSIIVNLKED